MRRLVLTAAAAFAGLLLAAPAGASTASVAALQVALRAQGLYAGSVDGVKGPITKGAIVAFQRRQGLVPDGRIGAQTRRALGELGNPLLGQRSSSSSFPSDCHRRPSTGASPLRLRSH